MSVQGNPLLKEISNLSWTDLTPETVESVRQHFLEALSPEQQAEDPSPIQAFTLYFKTPNPLLPSLMTGRLITIWCLWHGVFTIAEHRKALETYRQGEWVTPYPDRPSGSPPPLQRRPDT
ncbi:hypothetical protein SAMN02745166_05005 [Prosthecobacter debontii]|uniref:Uncharacterized protein n=1 Tax=Prosthecobacter debontii TaxID=48467 RepID=A0A1T4Z4C1_9BACT|nr:hypothetical protein SAMN02745166_05005 [Prosthecobacter debontii]